MKITPLFLIAFLAFVVCENSLGAIPKTFETYPQILRGGGDCIEKIDDIDIGPLPDYARISNYIDENKENDWSKQQLRMTVNAQEYDLNEPIFARLFLKNVSDTNLLYYFDPIVLGSNITLSIVHEDGKPFEKITKGAGLCSPYHPYYIKYEPKLYNFLRPGRETQIYRLGEYTQSLDKMYRLNRPGKYTVTASYIYGAQSPVFNADNEESGETRNSVTITAEPVEFVIRNKKYMVPSYSPLPKDEWGNNYFHDTRFRMIFNTEEKQSHLTKESAIDIILFTVEKNYYGGRIPALEKVPNNSLQLTLTTPEGKKITEAIIGDTEKMVDLKGGIIRLSDIFDLSKPGKYRVCGQLDSIKEGQRFVPPLQTNDLEFEIE
ncbi:MAG: hypothetical protein ACRC2T_07840 [Thermoguttaceae bacterium]